MDGEDSFGVRVRRRVDSAASMAKFLWHNMTVEPIIFFSVFSMGMGMVLQTVSWIFEIQCIYNEKFLLD